jgi:hypothetical protein
MTTPKIRANLRNPSVVSTNVHCGSPMRLFHLNFAVLIATLLVGVLAGQKVSDQSQPRLESPSGTPTGLTLEQWKSVRAAHDKAKHAMVRVGADYEARNPGQGMLARFTDGGVRVYPDAAQWSWGLTLKSYGFEGAERNMQGLPRCNPVGSRMTYQWDACLDEWYVNDSRGLEHGYTLRQRPVSASGSRMGPLRFRLATHGDFEMRFSTDQTSVVFHDATGQARINYAGLTVYDATGAQITAWLEADKEDLVLAVDDKQARYPLTIDPIVQLSYLKASNTEAGDGFGYSVAMDGDLLVVGAPFEDSNGVGVNSTQQNGKPDSGAAYIFRRSDFTYVQEAYLKASNTDARDWFGLSVAISGNTVVVGAPDEDSSGIRVNGSQGNGAGGSGAAYVFVRNGTTWTQEAYLKASTVGAGIRFGWDVDIEGDRAVVGAYKENQYRPHSGAAYIYERSPQTGWAFEQKLKASNWDSYDNFGNSVAITGNTVAVGAWRESSSSTGINGSGGGNNTFQSGAVYLFTRSGSKAWPQTHYIKSSNTDGADWFGWAIAASGDTIVISAKGEDGPSIVINGNQGNGTPDSGAAYVFVKDGSTWRQQAYLKPTNTGRGDRFGQSVAIDKDRIIIGSEAEDSSAVGPYANQLDEKGRDSGAAYVFLREYVSYPPNTGKYSGYLWHQVAYLKASNTDPGDNFGCAVAISGEKFLVGAYNEDGDATGVNNGQSTNLAAGAGAAYAFDTVCITSASSQRVGTGCSLSIAAPDLRADRPVQGQICRFFTSSFLPQAPGVVLVGIPHKGTPLGSTCVSYLDLSMPMVPLFFVTNVTGDWLSPNFTIGTSQYLMCSETMLQVAIQEPPNAPLGLALSNGVLLTIGR